MRVKRLLPTMLSLALTFGCALFNQPSGPQTYQDESFLFQYPATWQTMSELWEDRYQPDKDYFHLGLTELIMITDVQTQGDFGIWFAVAVTPLPNGLDLEACYRQIYAPYLSEFRDFAEQPVTLNGMNGFEVRYSRPWGEPWWQFQDTWLENDGTVYLLSFHTGGLEPYQAEIASILESFTFK